MDLKHHPAADAFPMFDAKRHAELVDDIKRHGQREPITICDGMILDGRNRYKACRELGITPKTRDWQGDPWAFAWSLNGQRRDLVDEQRYLIWKYCHEQSEAFQAEKKRIEDEANKRRSQAAIEGKVGKASKNKEEPLVLQQSVVVLNDHRKGQQAKAIASNTNPGAAQRGDKLAKARPDLATKVMRGELKPAEAHRQMKKDEVAKKVTQLPQDQFTVIYADPPWKYNDSRAGDTVGATGAEHHYPTMSLSELKALDISRLAAADSVLWLWATCPLLEDALELCQAWGFKYKAQFVWDKVGHNMGHYNSVRHEVLLICTKGSCTPENVKLFDSVQTIEKTKKHSEKPEEFREIINTLYPSGKKIELFRRGDAPNGWSVWGNESE
jgi:N6-adenosine-specific RNA methylase IME4